MDVFEAIDKRYSFRGEFLDRGVPHEDLVKIVQAGLNAPSGCNAQTSRFVVVDQPPLLEAIAAILDNRPVLRTARAMILCLASHRPVFQGMAFGVEDAAAAVENMLLAITALGYASVWMDGALRVEGRNRRIGALLGVPGDFEVRVLLPLGRPAAPGPRKPKLPFAERVAFNGFPTASPA